MKVITFGEAAEVYFRTHSKKWRSLKHSAQWMQSVLGRTLRDQPSKQDHCRALRPLAVRDIDTATVIRVLDPIWNEKPETASRVRGRIESVLAWATVRGFRSGDNPARWQQHLEEALPAKEAKPVHYAALPYAELPAFMTELRACEGIAARALEFTILTCARTGETIGARHGEINFTGKTWTVPPGRMKGGLEHRVALSERAVELLRALPTENGNEHVFIGSQTGAGLSSVALTAVLKRMGRGDITTHGFRSTFRDWAAEQTNFPREVAELALAHAVGDETERAYRRGDLLQKRHALAEAWARYCTSPPAASAESNVVSISGGRS
jgi:integrase